MVLLMLKVLFLSLFAVPGSGSAAPAGCSKCIVGGANVIVMSVRAVVTLAVVCTEAIDGVNW